MSNLNSSRAPEPVGAYPHAKRVGDFLYLSGVGPRGKGTDEIPGGSTTGTKTYDIGEQCHSVFENVRTILEDAGAKWEDLIDVTVFLTNMEDDFATYNKIYADYFGKIKPCRTTIGISSLPTPIAIELKCIAYLGS